MTPLEVVRSELRALIDEASAVVKRAGLNLDPAADRPAVVDSLQAFANSLPQTAALEVRLALLVFEDAARLDLTLSRAEHLTALRLSEVAHLSMRLGGAHALLVGLKRSGVLPAAEAWLRAREARSEAASASNQVVRARRQRQKARVIVLGQDLLSRAAQPRHGWTAPTLAQAVFEDWSTDGAAVEKRPDVSKLVRLVREAVGEGTIQLPPKAPH